MRAAIPANKGRFDSEDEALKAIVERLVDALDPQAIWLFGSRARGDARPDSDFDLLVVAKPGGKFGGEDYGLVDSAVRELRVGCDLVPCAADDFNEALQLDTSFVAQIAREGRQLYGSAP